jgi:hypothetical protein
MTAALSRPLPGPGDAQIWSPYAGHPLDPRAPLDDDPLEPAPTRPAHTPGPWRTRGLDFVPHVIGGNPEFAIADAACGRNPRDEDRANATLIAAAPDLLDALRGAEKYVANSLARHREAGRLACVAEATDKLAAVRAAIARATGAAS